MDKRGRWIEGESNHSKAPGRERQAGGMTADSSDFPGEPELFSPRCKVDCKADESADSQGDPEALSVQFHSLSVMSAGGMEDCYSSRLNGWDDPEQSTENIPVKKGGGRQGERAKKSIDRCKGCEMKRLAAKSKQKEGLKRPVFGNVRTFVIFLSILQLMQVMGSGYSKSALTSIERRYQLSTFSVGLLQSCFHVGNLSVILFVSYFGSKWNRPRAIAIGSLLMAVSSFVSAIPQFVGSRYEVLGTSSTETLTGVSAKVYMDAALLEILNNTRRSTRSYDATGTDVVGNPSTENSNAIKRPISLIPLKNPKAKLCSSSAAKSTAIPAGLQAGDLISAETVKPGGLEIASRESTTSTSGEKGESRKKSAGEVGSGSSEKKGGGKAEYWDDSSLYIFIAIGSVLKGMGHSPLHPLGMSFVDDFATPRNSAVYIGIVSALSLLGPAFGFILGSLTTGTWVDWGWVDVSKLDIDPHDPLWVGAWWMGYVVTAFLLLMATVPFCMFPGVIPREEDDRSGDGACLLCFRRSCTDSNSSSDAESEHSCCESSEHDADDKTADSACDKCQCKVTINLTDHTVRTDDNFLGQTFQPLGDRLKEYEVMLMANAHGEGSELLKTEATDIDNEAGKPVQLISYLERPKDEHGNEEVVSVTTEYGKVVPFSLSEIRFPSVRSHSVVSRIGNLTKSASVPAVTKLLSGYKPEWLEVKRQWLRGLSTKSKVTSSRRTSKTCQTRRASRIEKLALVDFTASLRGLLTDVVFLSTTTAFVCLTSFLAASVTYVSKYMESQFSVTASLANLLNGSVNLPMAVVGNLLGGWVIRRFNLNVRRTMAVAVSGLALTIICVTTLLFFKCNEGTHADYSFGNERDSCSAACNCGDAYAPVCDVTTNITYRSACHAGCVDVGLLGKTQVYTGCRCLTGPNQNTTSGGAINPLQAGISGFLLRGPCQRPDCSKSHLPVFLGVMGTASLTAGLASTPSTLVILRIVPPAEKAFAIGIVFVFTRVLAWIPAPVYVGYVIDSACLRWSIIGAKQYLDDVVGKPGNGDRRHCEIYDKNRLRRNFFAVTGMLLVLSLLFYVVALYLETRRSRRRKRVDDERELSFDESPESPDYSTDQVTHPVDLNLTTSCGAEEREFLPVDQYFGSNELSFSAEMQKTGAEMELAEFCMTSEGCHVVPKSMSAPSLMTRPRDVTANDAKSNPTEEQKQIGVIRATAV